jgi:DNA-binding response OmpR family regulator
MSANDDMLSLTAIAACTSVVKLAACSMRILDLGLPDRDGMTVLSFIRGKGLTMPVLVLTSHDGKQAAIEGFDYLTKPFDMD